jgi:hypothetical protein
LLLLKLWESGNRSCDFQRRFLPVFSTAFTGGQTRRYCHSLLQSTLTASKTVRGSFEANCRGTWTINAETGHFGYWNGRCPASELVANIKYPKRQLFYLFSLIGFSAAVNRARGTG